MRIRAKQLVAVLSVVSILTPAYAQQDMDSMSLEQLMVKEAAITVASKTPETVFNSVSNVTVIDREMIERYNFGTVGEALETLAGVMMWKTYFIKDVTTVRGALQDQYANKVLIMINNVPAWHGTTGEGDTNRVPIDAIERIEVLRGPASVLYGSNAFVGAINIVLKQPKKGKEDHKITVGAGTGAGKYEGYGEVTRGAGMTAKTEEDYHYHVSAGLLNESQPVYIFKDENGIDTQVRDFTRTRAINLTGFYKGFSVLANLKNSEETILGVVPAQGANAVPQATAAGGVGNGHEREDQLLNLAYDFGPNLYNLKYSATYDRQRRNVTRNLDDNRHSDIVGWRLSNGLSATFDLPASLKLDAGVDHDFRMSEWYNIYDTLTQNLITSTGRPNENELRGQSLWEGSAYGQLTWTYDPIKVAAGSRYTRNKYFGGNVSSRGSVVFSINETNSLKAMVGQSFRSPTLFELYFLTTPVAAGGVVGQPNLEPEKTDTAELSYLTSFGNMFAQATGYWVEYKKAIFRTLGNTVRDGVPLANVNYYSNAGKYHVYGLELEARYQNPKTAAFVSLDMMQGNRGDSHYIPNAVQPVTGGANAGSNYTWNYKYAPHMTVSAGGSQNIGKFFVASTLNVYGRMATLRTVLPTQAWANATVGYKTGRFRHALTVQNLTGADVYIPEYVRQRVVETVPVIKDRRAEYTLSATF